MQTSWPMRRDPGSAAPRRLEDLLERAAEPIDSTVLADQHEQRGWVPAEPQPFVPVSALEPPTGRHRAAGSALVRRRGVAGVLPSTVREARWAVSWRAVLGAVLALLLLGAAVAARAAVEAPGSPVPERALAPAAGGPAATDADGGGGGGVAAEGGAAARGAADLPGAAEALGAAPAPATGGAQGGAAQSGGTAVAPPVVVETAELVVHVVGQVELPGVVRVPSGSRVGDALEAAGGATATADLARVNLARALVDGEQLVVPRPGEVLAPAPGPVLPPASGAGGAAGPSGVEAVGGQGSDALPLDLNTADLAALDTLPGIGPVLAQRILDWRADHGRFSNIDELGEITGIGEKLMAKLRAEVRV